MSPPFPLDQIYEVDPVTGQRRLFYTSPPNLCGDITGLAFTPDGLHLKSVHG